MHADLCQNCHAVIEVTISIGNRLEILKLAEKLNKDNLLEFLKFLHQHCKIKTELPTSNKISCMISFLFSDHVMEGVKLFVEKNINPYIHCFDLNTQAKIQEEAAKLGVTNLEISILNISTLSTQTQFSQCERKNVPFKPQVTWIRRFGQDHVRNNEECAEEDESDDD